MNKSPDAFRTISEVSEWLDTPTYVLRFWESRFPQIKPVKRAGGRRYYRPEDMMLLGGIKTLLHFEERSIKDVKTMLKENGVKHVMDMSPDLDTPVVSPQTKADTNDKAEIAKMIVADTDTKTAADKPKQAVEVRVVKKGKLAKTATDLDEASQEVASQVAPPEAETEEATVTPVEAAPTDPSKQALAKAEAEEAARTELARKAAAEKVKADEEAEDWEELAPDMIRNAPYAIRPASEYSAEALGEIETLYYGLRMVRNGMKRRRDNLENRAG